MQLFILTNADGSPIADKTASAVTSVTDSTVLGDLGNVVLGDSEPITLKFTTGSAAPAFAGDSSYGVAVSLGELTSDGSADYTGTTSFSAITGGWTGRLALDTVDLFRAVGGIGAPVECCNPKGRWLTLQVRITNPSGNVVTYALLPVFVEWRVVATEDLNESQAASYIDLATFLTGAVHPRPAITSLTGGGATALDGLETANDALPTGYTLLLSYGRVGQTWQLIAGTDAESPSTGVVRPDDYNGTTNARIWVQL